MKNSLPLLFSILLLSSGCTTSGSLDGRGATLSDANKSNKQLSANLVNRRESLSNGPLSSPAGSGLSDGARNKALDAEYQALENGRPGNPIAWKHSTDQQGEVIPFQPYQVGDSNCRRYTHIFIIGGKRKPATATACRETDGRWVPLT